MSAPTPQIRWKLPFAAWLLMCLIAGAVILDAYTPSGGARYPLAMEGSACLMATLAFGLVGVAKLSPLERVIATAGWLFISLLAMLSFVDLLTRRG